MLPPHLRQMAEKHIDELAAKHRIYVRRSRAWDTSEAALTTMMVMIPKQIRTGTDYLAALHEIGHLVDPDARELDVLRSRKEGKKRVSDMMETALNEAAAWAWAVQNAEPRILKAFTKADWKRIGCCWVSWLGPVW